MRRSKKWCPDDGLTYLCDSYFGQSMCMIMGDDRTQVETRAREFVQSWNTDHPAKPAQIESVSYFALYDPTIWRCDIRVPESTWYGQERSEKWPFEVLRPHASPERDMGTITISASGATPNEATAKLRTHALEEALHSRWIEAVAVVKEALKWARVEKFTDDYEYPLQWRASITYEAPIPTINSFHWYPVENSVYTENQSTAQMTGLNPIA